MHSAPTGHAHTISTSKVPAPATFKNPAAAAFFYVCCLIYVVLFVWIPYDGRRARALRVGGTEWAVL